MPRRRNGEIPLPDGWDVAQDFDGKVYFIDHNTRKTTWVDPRDKWVAKQFIFTIKKIDFYTQNCVLNIGNDKISASKHSRTHGVEWFFFFPSLSWFWLCEETRVLIRSMVCVLLSAVVVAAAAARTQSRSNRPPRPHSRRQGWHSIFHVPPAIFFSLFWKKNKYDK